MSVKSHFFINFVFWARFFFFSNLQEKSRLQGRSELASRSISKNSSSELISTYFEKGERRKKGDPKVVRKLMPTPTVVKLYCRQIEANERDKLAESFLDYNTQAHTLCCECSYTSSGGPEGPKT